jgi:hypothetical protein
MTNTNEQQTELGKLGKKFHESVLDRTLAAVALAAVVVFAGNSVQEYKNTEKSEVVQLERDGVAVQKESHRIMRESGDQAATDLYVLKLAVQEKRDELNGLVADSVVLRNVFGWHEDRVERAASYQRMMDSIDGKIATLEEQGDRPFQNVDSR